MGISFDELMNDLAEERRNRIMAEAGRLETEYQILQMFRKAKRLTQAELGDILDMEPKVKLLPVDINP